MAVREVTKMTNEEAKALAAEVFEAEDVTVIGYGETLHAIPTGWNPPGPVRLAALPAGQYRLEYKGQDFRGPVFYVLKNGSRQRFAILSA
jgi:hypothetical protein